MSPKDRHYQPITAETYRLNQFLYTLVKGDRAMLQRFVKERGAALAESPLTAEEREAVAAIDLPRLCALGAHPFLARNLYSAVHRMENPEGYVTY